MIDNLVNKGGGAIVYPFCFTFFFKVAIYVRKYQPEFGIRQES